MKVNIFTTLLVFGCLFITETQQAQAQNETMTPTQYPQRSLEEDDDAADDDDKKPVTKPAAPAAKATAKPKSDDDTTDDDTNKSDEKPADDVVEEDDDEKQARIQKEIEALNDNTKKAFANQFDSSEDFSYDNMNNFQSGQYADEMTEDQKIAQFAKLISKGPIIELLEPKARQFNNVPQAKAKNKRIDCPANDGTQKAHFLTVQGSKNYFEWRVKRSSKVANCTMRISLDGENYTPLKPMTEASFNFPCGRSAGYESFEYQLPKQYVAEHGAVMQFEWETESGVIVQCADVIIQRYNSFEHVKCDPACKNGGICQNGVCKCGKMYSGGECEVRMDSSGSFSFMMYLFIIALFGVGIYMLMHQAESRRQIKQFYENQQKGNQNSGGFDDNQFDRRQQYVQNDDQNFQ